jgi:hypothetical protein
MSFWLLEPLPAEALQILIDEAVEYTSGGFVVYEFQTVGGDPQGSGVPDARGHVWTNNFSSVDPLSTAFPHRNARHCLMFKAQTTTEEAYPGKETKMRRAHDKIATYIRGQSPYYNHMDIYLSGVEPYFEGGVDTLWEQGWIDPVTSPVNKRYYLERLSRVRASYNLHGTMANLRAVPPPNSSLTCKAPSSTIGVDAAFIYIFLLGTLTGVMVLGVIVRIRRSNAHKKMGFTEQRAHEMHPLRSQESQNYM